jgi:hypothetical protein
MSRAPNARNNEIETSVIFAETGVAARVDHTEQGGLIDLRANEIGICDKAKPGDLLCRFVDDTLSAAYNILDLATHEGSAPSTVKAAFAFVDAEPVAEYWLGIYLDGKIRNPKRLELNDAISHGQLVRAIEELFLSTLSGYPQPSEDVVQTHTSFSDRIYGRSDNLRIALTGEEVAAVVPVHLLEGGYVVARFSAGALVAMHDPLKAEVAASDSKQLAVNLMVSTRSFLEADPEAEYCFALYNHEEFDRSHSLQQPLRVLPTDWGSHVFIAEHIGDMTGGFAYAGGAHDLLAAA